MRIWLSGKTARQGAEMICNKDELEVLKRALGMLCNDEMERVQNQGPAARLTKRLTIASNMYDEIESYIHDVYGSKVKT